MSRSRGDELLLGGDALRRLELDVLRGGDHPRHEAVLEERVGLVAHRVDRVGLVAQVAERRLAPVALVGLLLLHLERLVAHLLQHEGLALEALGLLDREARVEVVEDLDQLEPLALDHLRARDPLLDHRLLVGGEARVPRDDALGHLRVERLEVHAVAVDERVELLLQVRLDVLEHLDPPRLLRHERALEALHVALDGDEAVLALGVLGVHVRLQLAEEGLELVGQRVQPRRVEPLLRPAAPRALGVVRRRRLPPERLGRLPPRRRALRERRRLGAPTADRARHLKRVAIGRCVALSSCLPSVLWQCASDSATAAKLSARSARLSGRAGAVPSSAEFNKIQTKFVRGWNSLFSTDFIAFGTQVSCERAFYLPF